MNISFYHREYAKEQLLGGNEVLSSVTALPRTFLSSFCSVHWWHEGYNDCHQHGSLSLFWFLLSYWQFCLLLLFDWWQKPTYVVKMAGIVVLSWKLLNPVIRLKKALATASDLWPHEENHCHKQMSHPAFSSNPAQLLFIHLFFKYQYRETVSLS